MNKSDIEKRLGEVKTNSARIASIDGPSLKTLGSNEPLATQRVRDALANGAKMTAAEIIAQCRADGYSGPDSRIQQAIARLQECQAVRPYAGRKFALIS